MFGGQGVRGKEANRGFLCFFAKSGWSHDPNGDGREGRKEHGWTSEEL